MSLRVDRVELQRLAAGGVDDVVLGAGGNDDRRAVRDLVLVAVDDDVALTRLEAEELVVVLVNLRADIFVRLQAHQDELTMCVGVEDLAKVVVFQRQLFDVSVVSLHSVLQSLLAWKVRASAKPFARVASVLTTT